MRCYWTEGELRILRSYPGASKQQLLSQLPRWSWNSIRHKARSLGLYRLQWPWNKGLGMSEELRTKVSLGNKKWWEENKQGKGEKCLAALELGRTPEAGKKVSKSVKAWWDNPDNLEKIEVRNRNVRLGILKAVAEGRCQPLVPNKLELRLSSLLDIHFPGEWVYSGDGKVTLEGFKPDFINCNGKKLIIELAGGRWHSREYEHKRSETFRKFGYETLVIWDRTLEGKRILRANRKWPEGQLVGLIRKFMTGGCTILRFGE